MDWDSFAANINSIQSVGYLWKTPTARFPGRTKKMTVRVVIIFWQGMILEFIWPSLFFQMQSIRIFVRGISAKQGNKNYYKGNRSGRMGSWTLKGKFIVEKERTRQFIVPESLQTSPLSVSISPKYTPSKKSHSVLDYFGEAWQGDEVIGEQCKVKADLLYFKTPKTHKSRR